MSSPRSTRESTADPVLARLRRLLERSRAGDARSYSDRELLELPRLYRYAASRLAHAATSARDESRRRALNALVARAHQVLFAGVDDAREPLLRRAVRFFANEVPRAIRAEWKLLLANAVILYGLSAAAYFAVANDLELAYSLLDPGAVAHEIQQLEQTSAGEPFRGNFTFGVGKSSMAAGSVMGNNMRVSVVFFASALVPPLYAYILGVNALMLGTYTGVAAHWDQAGAISSILWCHGTLEIQAIVLAGTAGLLLARAWIAPGPWSRRHAIVIERARALRLLAASFPMLFFAGLIEGFVSPHAPFAVRIAVAVLSGLLLIAWIGLGGRERAER